VSNGVFCHSEHTLSPPEKDEWVGEESVAPTVPVRSGACLIILNEVKNPRR
jgi:hypothetical protein